MERLNFRTRFVVCQKMFLKMSYTRSEFGLIEIENLVEYAYTGQLTISTTNVQDLIICAQYLRMVIQIQN